MAKCCGLSSYSSFAKLNPFHDERCTKLGDFYDLAAPKNGSMTNRRPPVPPQSWTKGHKSPGMPHSQSESNIDYHAPPTNAHNLRVGKVFAVRDDTNARFSEDSGNSLLSHGALSFSRGDSFFSRGRSLSRTPSPVKVLEDIKEDQSPGSPVPVPKRSHSPFKKLIGEGGWLGKSASFKELPDEQYRRKGFKRLGGKIKQRVEDLVRY